MLLGPLNFSILMLKIFCITDNQLFYFFWLKKVTKSGAEQVTGKLTLHPPNWEKDYPLIEIYN